MDKYKIFWKYSTKPVKRDSLGKVVKEETITECIIEKKTELGSSIIFSQGTAVCKHNDNFSKREGRKRSFKRAVSLIKHDRDLREKLWNQFIEMTPKSIKKIK